MKYASLLLVAIALLFASEVQAKTIREMTEAMKQPMTIEAGKSPRMNVTFNHSSHSGINCFTCHHVVAEKDGRYVPCTNCHTGKGRSNDPSSRFMAFHSSKSTHSCYTCHKTKVMSNPTKYAAFRGCRPCHMPMSQKTAAAK